MPSSQQKNQTSIVQNLEVPVEEHAPREVRFPPVSKAETRTLDGISPEASTQWKQQTIKFRNLKVSMDEENPSAEVSIPSVVSSSMAEPNMEDGTAIAGQQNQTRPNYFHKQMTLPQWKQKQTSNVNNLEVAMDEENHSAEVNFAPPTIADGTTMEGQQKQTILNRFHTQMARPQWKQKQTRIVSNLEVAMDEENPSAEVSFPRAVLLSTKDEPTMKEGTPMEDQQRLTKSNYSHKHMALPQQKLRQTNKVHNLEVAEDEDKYYAEVTFLPVVLLSKDEPTTEDWTAIEYQQRQTISNFFKKQKARPLWKQKEINNASTLEVAIAEENNSAEVILPPVVAVEPTAADGIPLGDLRQEHEQHQETPPPRAGTLARDKSIEVRVPTPASQSGRFDDFEEEKYRRYRQRRPVYTTIVICSCIATIVGLSIAVGYEMKHSSTSRAVNGQANYSPSSDPVGFANSTVDDYVMQKLTPSPAPSPSAGTPGDDDSLQLGASDAPSFAPTGESSAFSTSFDSELGTTFGSAVESLSSTEFGSGRH